MYEGWFVDNVIGNLMYLPLVPVCWFIWTMMDAWYGGRLTGWVKALKRKIKGQKKPGRKAQSEEIKALRRELTGYKSQLKDKKQLVNTVKKVVEDAQKKEVKENEQTIY